VSSAPESRTRRWGSHAKGSGGRPRDLRRARAPARARRPSRRDRDLVGQGASRLEDDPGGRFRGGARRVRSGRPRGESAPEPGHGRSRRRRGARARRDDDRVAAFVARIGAGGMGLAQAQELRDAVLAFRGKGKRAVAWAETFGESGPGTSATTSRPPSTRSTCSPRATSASPASSRRARSFAGRSTSSASSRGWIIATSTRTR